MKVNPINFGDTRRPINGTDISHELYGSYGSQINTEKKISEKKKRGKRIVEKVDLSRKEDL